MSTQIPFPEHPHTVGLGIDPGIGRRSHGDVVGLHATILEVFLYGDPHRGAAAPDADDMGGGEAGFVHPARQTHAVEQQAVGGDEALVLSHTEGLPGSRRISSTCVYLQRL